MSNKSTFLVVGGDLRQTYLAEILANYGKVYTLGLENSFESKKTLALRKLDVLPELVDYLVLPIPVTDNQVYVNMPMSEDKVSIYSLIPYLNPNAVVFGGKVGAEASIFTYKGFEVIDYLKREELSVLNAIPTSEGAIQLAMQELPTTIYGRSILITGFGRISKVMVKALIGLGADVTVTARKYSDLEWAHIAGCKAVHIKDLSSKLSEFDIVFNTVPAVIFSEKELSYLKEDCLVIDLASKPGGVDFDITRKLGIKAIWALSLPGKVAPVTSGEMIATTIMNIITERGEAIES